MLFENFTIAGFKDLEAELESQFRVAPTDTVCYQLATTLAQCMPTARSLRRADQLLMRATRPGCELSEELRQSALDVHRSVRAIHSNGNIFLSLSTMLTRVVFMLASIPWDTVSRPRWPKR
ncbi:hypothetical protein A4G26_26690 [Mycobacterium kansasii]|nr:hypothetical protein A4G26_26690 [Mycobacterium kansasii]